MKITRLVTSFLVLALIVVGLVLFFSRGGKQRPVLAAESSVERTSYNDVAPYLDSGGSLYLYLSTEQWLEGLSDKIAKWKGIFANLPMNPQQQGDVDKTFDLVTHIVKDSGVEDVSGLGMSSIALDQDIYRTRLVLHHYKGKGSGFGWTMFGKAPHPLTGLDMAPATTALAVFSDFDQTELWSVVQDELKHSGFPQAQQGLDQFTKQFKRSTGLDWDKVLGSLGGEYGIILTLDDAKMVQLPLPTAEPLEIPEPGLLIVAKVNDDTLFNRLEQTMTQTRLQVDRVNKDHLKMRTVELPIPSPITVRPSIASADGYLYIASNDQLIEDALAVKAVLKTGLKGTDDFKRVDGGMPTVGNRYAYVSKSFGQTYFKIWSTVMQMRAAQPGQMAFFKNFMNPDNAKFGLSVAATTDEGFVVVANGNQNGAVIAAAVPVAVVAVGTAMVLPAVAAAKARAARINAARRPQP